VLRLIYITLSLLAMLSMTAAAAVPIPSLKPGVELAVQKTRPLGARYFKGKTPYPELKPDNTAPKITLKPVIVIDPGHGGTDPGAIAVIVTRKQDIHVDHDDRLRIARAGQADLFISIHADSASNKSARGASVYTLADRAKGRSKRIVNNQNWILDVDLSEQTDPVGDILVDLAQRKTESQSDAFAGILLSELKGKTALVGNSHRRAGYYVLLAPDVPAVLLELGFLSNPEDEKLLNQASHRTKILSSVERAIDRYMNQR